MNAWDIFDCAFPWGSHPAVIISNEERVKRKPQVVVLPCTTMRPQSYRDAEGLEILLDEADGLDWKTLCKCDVPMTVAKASLNNRRGSVTRPRRAQIARKVIQALAFEGI